METTHRYRAYWIREYNPESGEYTLSPVDGKSEAIKAKIDPGGDKSKVTEALLDTLDRRNGGTAPVRCVLKTDSKSNTPLIHQVVPQGLPRDKDSRKILDENGEHLSTWTTDLDKEVFKHAEFSAYQEIIGSQIEALNNPEAFKVVREKAEGILEEVIRKHKDKLPRMSSAPQPADTYLPTTAQNAFRGDEMDNLGAMRQKRYHANIAYDEQAGIEDSEYGLTQLGNYAMQKAIIECTAEAAQKTVIKNGTPLSSMEAAQDKLIGEDILLAGHPGKSKKDMIAQSQEMARVLGACALAGTMAHMGAKAPAPDSDPLLKIEATTGQRIRCFPIHGEIENDMAEQLKERNIDPASLSDKDKLRSYTAIAESRGRLYREAAKKKVYEKQSVAVPAKGKKPTPPKPSNGLEESQKDSVLDAAASAGNAVDQAVNDMGSIPFPGLG